MLFKSFDLRTIDFRSLDIWRGMAVVKVLVVTAAFLLLSMQFLSADDGGSCPVDLTDTAEHCADMAPVLTEEAHLLESNGDLVGAWIKYRNAITVDRWYQPAHEARAFLTVRLFLLAERDPDEVIAFVEYAFEGDPKDDLLFQISGRAHEAGGDYAAALSDYRAAIAYAERSTAARLLLTDLLMSQELFDEAEQQLADLRQYIGSDGTLVAELRQQLSEMQNSGNQEAVQLTRDRIRAASGAVWNLKQLESKYYSATGSYQEAERIYSELILWQPESTDFLIDRAEVRAKLDRIDGAITDLNSALDLNIDKDALSEAQLNEVLFFRADLARRIGDKSILYDSLNQIFLIPNRGAIAAFQEQMNNSTELNVPVTGNYDTLTQDALKECILGSACSNEQ